MIEHGHVEPQLDRPGASAAVEERQGQRRRLGRRAWSRVRPPSKAGIKAGDIITRFRGQAGQRRTARTIAAGESTDFRHAGGRNGRSRPISATARNTSAKVTTEPLQRALGEPQELKDWGIAVRDITRMMALERHRKNTSGRAGRFDSRRRRGRHRQAPLGIGGRDPRVDGQAGRRRRRPEKAHRQTDRRTRPSGCRSWSNSSATRKQLLTVVKIGQEENKNRPRVGQQTLVEHGHAGVDLRSGRVARHGRPARRPRHRSLQGPGRRKGRRQGGRHHPGRQRPEDRRLAARRPRGFRHDGPPAYRRRQGHAENRPRRQADGR